MATDKRTWSLERLHVSVRHPENFTTSVRIPYPWRATRAFIGGHEVAITRPIFQSGLDRFWHISPAAARDLLKELHEKPIIGNDTLRSLFYPHGFVVTHVGTGVGVWLYSCSTINAALEQAIQRVQEKAERATLTVPVVMDTAVRTQAERIDESVYLPDWLEGRGRDFNNAPA